MELKTKVNLIKKLSLTPEQINFLELQNTIINFENDILDEDIDFLINQLNKKLEQLLQIKDEQNCLYLAHIISTIENKNLKSILMMT